jgi:hypothetical protein
VVGDNHNFVTSGFERFGFFVDAYVTAPVREVGGGGDHEDFETGGHRINTNKHLQGYAG